MQAKPGVIDWLNTLLTNELTAINQYFVQAEMCAHWGLEGLYHHLRRLSIEEMREAEQLIEHIFYLEGLPNLQRLNGVQIGETVEEHLQLDLQLERNQDQALAQAIEHCDQVGDYTTRTLLEQKIVEEKEHISWLETQLDTIEQVGLQNYLAQHLRKETDS